MCKLSKHSWYECIVSKRWATLNCSLGHGMDLFDIPPGGSHEVNLCHCLSPVHVEHAWDLFGFSPASSHKFSSMKFCKNIVSFASTTEDVSDEDCFIGCCHDNGCQGRWWVHHQRRVPGLENQKYRTRFTYPLMRAKCVREQVILTHNPDYFALIMDRNTPSCQCSTPDQNFEA